MSYNEIKNPHQTWRRDRGAIHYFHDNRIDSIFSGLVRSPDEVRQADEQAKKEVEAKQKSQQNPQQPQNQQPQNLRQPQAPNMDQALRESEPHSETRGKQSQQADNQRTLRQAAGQDLKEVYRDQFQNRQPNQMQSELRSSTSGTPSFLQNMRNLSGQNARGEQALPQDRNPNPANPGRNPTLNSNQSGLRIADLSRFAGIQEHVQLAQQNTHNTASMLNRSPGRQTFNPENPFSRLPNQSFPRAFNPQTFGQLIQQAASHLPEQHPFFTQQNMPVAAFLHGNMLFVKDGDRLRTYRLLEDGTLHETSQEHEGSPLTPEARAEMSRVLRQKGIHARLSGERGEMGETRELEGEGRSEFDRSSQRAQDRSMNARGELRTLSREDSHFAHLLREVLEEGREVGQELGEGEEAQFASKKDWSAFFGRMLGMGSAEKKGKKTFDQMMGFIFRGLYKKQGEAGSTLVSDIKYQLSGKTKEDRFAQIGIEDAQLIALLQKFTPGQAISKDLLKQYFGEEITFTQLIHVIHQSDPLLASELLKNVKFDPSSTINLYDQAKLEHHIFSNSKRRPSVIIPGPDLSSPENAGALFDGNAYNLFDKQKRDVFGKVKLYTFLTYAGLLVGVFFLFYFLLKA